MQMTKSLRQPLERRGREIYGRVLLAPGNQKHLNVKGATINDGVG